MTTEATTENQEETAEELIRTALANNTPERLFIDGDETIEKILNRIETLSRSVPADLTTAKGRKLIASTAHKIARSKVYLDEIGKNLVAEWKTKTALVDQSRKKIRDRLDNLKDEIRGPLTEWESAEAARVERCKAEVERLRLLVASMTDAKTLDAIDDVIKQTRETFLHQDDEYAEAAAHWKKTAEDYFHVAHSRIHFEQAAAAERAKAQAELDAQRAELARMRAAMEAERAELARLKAEIESARAKPEPAPETPCGPFQSLAEIVNGIDEPIDGYTRGNRDEPPAEEWDDSEPDQADDHIAEPGKMVQPHQAGPNQDPNRVQITERDAVVFVSKSSDAVRIGILQAELKRLAEVAHESYRATIRQVEIPACLKPYLVRLNDAVYRAYDVVGHKPAEIQAGALAEKGGA